MGDEYWVCDCPICERLVKPLFKLLTPKEPKYVRGEGLVSQEQRDRELEELKELVSALKDSIVELKATLMDAVSPFSKMRTGEAEVIEEERLEPISAQPASAHPYRPLEPQPEPSIKVEERKIERPAAGEISERAPTPAAQRAKEPQIPTEGPTYELRAVRPVTTLNLRKSLKLLKLLFKLSQSIPSQQIETYINFMKTTGLIDDKAAESLMVLKQLVDSGVQAGIEPEDQIIAMYSIAKMMGITDPELEEEIAFSLAERLKRKEAQ